MTIIFEIAVFLGLRIELYLVLLPIAAMSFFFWRWLFKKYSKAGSSSKFPAWLVTIIVTPLIYFSLVWLLTYKTNRTFEPYIWSEYPEARYRMSNDLINKNILRGKDTTEVRQLLGEPNSKPNSNLAINRWFYSLGESDLMFMPIYHNLIIRFTDGKVSAINQLEIEQ